MSESPESPGTPESPEPPDVPELSGTPGAVDPLLDGSQDKPLPEPHIHRATGARRMPRCTKEELEQRVELARLMLMKGYTKGDIKRAFRKRFGVKHSASMRYLSYARARNMEMLGKTADENLSESLSDWQRMRHEAEETIRYCRGQLAELQRSEQTQESVLASPNASPEKVEAAARALDAIRKRETALTSRLASAQADIKESRREMDRLLGNHAPTKVAQTTTDGRDVAKAADSPSEPVDPVQELDEMAEQFRARAGMASGTDGPPADGNGQKLHTDN